MSQLSMTLGAMLFVAIAVCELVPAIRRHTGLPARAGIYFCAVTIYYLSVSGVACVDMESMMRYEFSVYALIVLALLNFLRQFRMPPLWVRVFATAAVALVSAAGLCLQGWYVWNFTRGHWVA
jgi:O-antigen ligase